MNFVDENIRHGPLRSEAREGRLNITAVFYKGVSRMYTQINSPKQNKKTANRKQRQILTNLI